MNATSGSKSSGTALKAITHRNQVDSPLLHLPAEIRNQIYCYVLGNKKITVDVHDVFSSEGEWGASAACALFPRQCLQLLEVCRQIYSEARLLPFSENVLQGDSDIAESYFQKGILGNDQMAAIRTIRIAAYRHTKCPPDGCVIGKAPPDLLSRLEHLVILEGLEKVAIALCCSLSMYPPSPRTQALLGQSIKQALWSDKDIEVKVITDREWI